MKNIQAETYCSLREGFAVRAYRPNLKIMHLLKSSLCFTLACALAHAATPSLESVERLLVVTEVEKLLTSMEDQMDELMKNAMVQAFRGQVLPPEAQQFADSFRKKMMANMKDEMSWARMKSLYIDIYRESFTQEEIDGLIAFYDSPSGKALVAKMPVVMQKSMNAMQQRMGPMMQKMQAAMTEALKEVEAIKQKEASAATEATDIAIPPSPPKRAP